MNSYLLINFFLISLSEQKGLMKSGIFSVCAPPPPSLVRAYYLHPPDARAIFLHSDLLCNGTCSVTGGGGHNVLGGGGAQTETIRKVFESR